MPVDPLGPILSLIILYLLGGFVRAASAALPYVDEAELRKEALRGVSSAARKLRLIEMSDKRMSDLSMAHALFGLGACAVACVRWSAPVGALPSGAAAFIIFLFVSISYFALAGLVPGYVAAHAPGKTLGATHLIARLCLAALLPITSLARIGARQIVKLFGIRPDQATKHVTEEEIRAMMTAGEEKGTIESDEKQMIENIFDFTNMDAEDCMIHRKDIIAIDIDDDPAEVITLIQSSGLSRFPVYQDDIDSVIGILITRDYLLSVCAGDAKPLRELIRPAYFVPESVHTDVLLREMRLRKQHIAIVVDEYGGTSGLITLEDLLEEIVGNIYDEFDPHEEQHVTFIGEGKYRIAGSLELDALGEFLQMELPMDDEYDTLGGLIYSQLSEIPADGQQPEVQCYGLKIKVEQIADRRVEWAIVEKIAPDENGAAREEQ